MRFSIVCTNFNKAPYLEECLKSILLQEFDDYELILIDDCSTDGSLVILQRFANLLGDKCRLLVHDVNQGMAASYNKAFALASGEILCLIDSDDCWYAGKLRAVDIYFRDNPDTVMLQHPLQIIDQFTPTKERYRPWLLTGDILQFAITTGEIPLFVATTGLSFCLKSIRRVLPIPLNFHNNGEAFLTRTVICYGQTGALTQVLGGYRRTGTNVVFGNESWDAKHYVENILKPELNRFYTENGINLHFPPVIPINKPSLISRLKGYLVKSLRF